MRVVVTEVRVCTVPFADPQEGRPWDLFSGPDLSYEVYGPDGTRLHRSSTVCDLRPPDLPVTLDGGFALTTPGPHVLRVLDVDLTTDEVMARVAFEPDRLVRTGGDPPSCVEFDEGETTLQVYFAWEQRP